MDVAIHCIKVMMVKEQGRKSTYFPGSLKGVGK
jgi:hypothetical protein